MNVLLIVLLVLLAVGAWYALIRVIPSCFTSLLRYELWRMRDMTVDEIRSGELHNEEQAERFVRELERAIQGADISLLNVLAFGRIARNIDLPLIDHIELDKLDAHDKKLLTARHDCYQWLVMRKALFGSPSGWLTTVLLFLIVGVYSLFLALIRALDRKQPRLGAQTRLIWRHEVEKVPVEPALAVLSERKKNSQLSALV